MNKEQFLLKLRERRAMLKRHNVEWMEEGFLQTPLGPRALNYLGRKK